MSQQELDALFSSSPSGVIPNGEAHGTAIIAPGTKFSSEIAALINIFVWKGKTFDATHGTLRNEPPGGLNAIVAEVYKAPSWFDNWRPPSRFRRLHLSPTTSATRSGRSIRAHTLALCIGTRTVRFTLRFTFPAHDDPVQS